MAFARIGSDTLEKGKESFLKMLDQGGFSNMEKTFKDLEKKVREIAKEQDVEKEVEKESEETEKKVTEMRDTYIDGKWNQESEVLEWMGFYTGASLVHWKLISGAAESMKFEELMTVSRQAIGFYNNLFVSDEQTLKNIGASSVK